MIAPSLPPPEVNRPHDLILEYLLLGDLREWLEEAPSEQSRAAISLILDVILDELSVLDGDDPFDGVIDDRPQWQREVDQLRGDRTTHYLQLAELRSCVEDGLSIPENAGEVKRRIRHWMETLAGLRRWEHRLVQMAANRDEGGEA